ncbi:ATP synthase N, epsilon subunit [Syntrophotalea carbinolica DSM 2380]|uniref:ATP synthase N, epsilon subunit n=1 Tax=Syntrophotalea carbinolica (strain DSM 2380 / NBRC 103641 / GraBd1) TaxID=338963 RepID=Q3A082_SYNC1|nr:F0F1 ATP synthase subunit epsilon [Syntrophotalea carbinolica]ABA90225.1 ATP synthase N, epsilon subunit [Syntrophotalea carbinolica DSM 2380]
MRLRVQTPAERILDCPVTKVVAEGLNGSFCLRPRHVDLVSAVVPGLFYYETAEGQGHYIALDRGLLVKRETLVSVSVRNAVAAGELEDLLEVVQLRFKALDEQERVVRSAVARLESDFLRRFMELS